MYADTRTMQLVADGYDFSESGMTWQQSLTIELLTPGDTTSTHVNARDDGTVLVEYCSDFGPYSDRLASYLILPGASYEKW